MSHTFGKRKRQKVTHFVDTYHHHKNGVDHSSAKYYAHYMEPETADNLLFELIKHNDNELFKQESWSFMGKTGLTKRRSLAFGEKGSTYTYSNRTIAAKDWKHSPVLHQLKKDLEIKFSRKFNYVLINRYPDGEAGIPWHSDNEKDMAEGSLIASISLGEPRVFQVRAKDKQKRKEIKNLELAHGSLLLMNMVMQRHYLHCLPVRKRIKKPRYNITFRNITKVTKK